MSRILPRTPDINAAQVSSAWWSVAPMTILEHLELIGAFAYPNGIVLATLLAKRPAPTTTAPATVTELKEQILGDVRLIFAASGQVEPRTLSVSIHQLPKGGKSSIRASVLYLEAKARKFSSIVEGPLKGSVPEALEALLLVTGNVLKEHTAGDVLLRETGEPQQDGDDEAHRGRAKRRRGSEHREEEADSWLPDGLREVEDVRKRR